MAVAIGKYDIYEATKQFNEHQRSILQNIRKMDDPIEQNKAVNELMNKVQTLSLEGIIYTRQNLEKRVLTYCSSQMYCKVNSILVFLDYPTDSEQINNDYNRIQVLTKDRKLEPQRIASSTGEISLKLVQFGCSDAGDDRENVKNGLHISIHPQSYLSDSEMKNTKKRTDYLQYQNDLEIFYRGVKKNKSKQNAGIFSTFRTAEINKYQQIIKYFSDGNSIMCLSFDYFFNAKKFKEACGQTNPFDFGFIHYLDLSIDYALLCGNYCNPTYYPSILQCCEKKPVAEVRLKSRNIEIMTWKAYKHLHIFLRLLANSKNIDKLEKLNLSGLHLTVDDLNALGQILEINKLKYLNMANTRIPREGLEILQNNFKKSSSLNILILDDLILYKRLPKTCSLNKRFEYTQIRDAEFASFLKEIAIFAQDLQEIYINWNEDRHKYKKYTISERKGSRGYIKQDAVQKAYLGPLGNECFELVNEILNMKNLRVCAVRQNQLPFDKIQYYAISLKSNQDIKVLELQKNTEIDEIDQTSCLTACFGSCFKQDDIPHKQVLPQVIEDIGKSCQFNRNEVIFKSFYDVLKSVYDKYSAEHNKQLKVDSDLRQQQMQLQANLKRLELEAEKRKEEEEHQKKLELNRAKASQFITVQTNHMQAALPDSDMKNSIIKAVMTDQTKGIKVEFDMLNDSTNKLPNRPEYNDEVD